MSNDDTERPDPEPLTLANLDAMTPEDLEAAREDGRLDDFMRGRRHSPMPPGIRLLGNQKP